MSCDSYRVKDSFNILLLQLLFDANSKSCEQIRQTYGCIVHKKRCRVVLLAVAFCDMYSRVSKWNRYYPNHEPVVEGNGLRHGANSDALVHFKRFNFIHYRPSWNHLEEGITHKNYDYFKRNTQTLSFINSILKKQWVCRKIRANTEPLRNPTTLHHDAVPTTSDLTKKLPKQKPPRQWLKKKLRLFKLVSIQKDCKNSSKYIQSGSRYHYVAEQSKYIGENPWHYKQNDSILY